jgi:hypothetical protein
MIIFLLYGTFLPKYNVFVSYHLYCWQLDISEETIVQQNSSSKYMIQTTSSFTKEMKNRLAALLRPWEA